jgi:NAD+ synthase (glutamine-hydrolysing)
VIHEGTVVGSYRKQALPNYAVFDEPRYFDPGPEGQPLVEIAGIRCAVSVCEDVWLDGGPAAAACAAGAQVILNVNASPFHVGKQRIREAMLRRRVEECGVPVAYLNLVSGQDDLVFDGGSVVIDAEGTLLARLERFEPDEQVVDVPVPDRPAPGAVRDVVVVSHDSGGLGHDPPADGVVAASPEGPAEVWAALCLGVRDYARKNGFTEVTLGLSGGVDSALVAAIAADALGPDAVHVVLMPSRFSSDHSVADALELAANLGVDARTVPIEPAHGALIDMLSPSFGDLPADLTEENLQSRIRGVVLMALSNKFGWLVLTTGNKSETAVGYSTLYGDTAGGLAVIKDVPKLLVYELCRWRNEQADGPVIPASILTKLPSAELREDQHDQQSLPPYEVLDPLIEAYVDGDATSEELISVGHDAELVVRIASLVDTAEYKRRQSPPGIRISEKAFGRDRRLPITNRYRPRRREAT